VSLPFFTDGFRLKYTFIQVYYICRHNVLEKELNIIHCLLTNRIYSVPLLMLLYYRIGPVLNYSNLSGMVYLCDHKVYIFSEGTCSHTYP